MAVDTVEKAHGNYEHWLWPMHAKENTEAGCQQCHSREIVTEMADTLNTGREIFRLRGCMGCHRYEGFDRDGDELSAANQQIRTLEQQKAEWLREAGFDISEGRQDPRQQRSAAPLRRTPTISRSAPPVSMRRWSSSTCAPRS